MGLGLVLFSTFLINHFDLFGLRQVWLCLVGRPYTHLSFRTPLLYKYVRHPLYIGWFMTFWFTPTMTATHLLFAAMCTAYIVIAIRWEEKDLVDAHGAKYVDYRSNVPMLLPSAKPYERLTPREALRRMA
jgi:protein-S-isoprenylcysteine O-methyltransferase Ste14